MKQRRNYNERVPNSSHNRFINISIYTYILKICLVGARLMTTNEEIIDKWETDYKLYFQGDREDYILLMDLAREDERSIANERVHNAIMDSWGEGYNKGCLETKEKIINQIKEHYCLSPVGFECIRCNILKELEK
jgi:hypothetical protein